METKEFYQFDNQFNLMFFIHCIHFAYISLSLRGELTFVTSMENTLIFYGNITSQNTTTTFKLNVSINGKLIPVLKFRERPLIYVALI